QLAEGEFQVVHGQIGKHRTLNIEHRTPKVKSVAPPRLRCSGFDVGCSMFVLSITQRLHRIDFRSSPRWEVARQQSHSDQHQGNGPSVAALLRNTSSCGRSTGSNRSRTVSTRLKIAVFAPMPSASVSTATAVKPGFFSNWRKANFRSFMARLGNIEH